MVKKNKSNIGSILVLFIFSLVGQSVQYVRDESFLRFCKNVGSSPIKSDTAGDKCVVTWDFPAADLKEAEGYCKTWAAHPLEKTELDADRPKCTYVNVYECRPDYTLIKGHCYRMVRKDMRTYDEAIADCKTQEVQTPHVTAQLITIFDNEQLRFIRAFFANLRGFWTKRRNVDERNYAVVYGLAQFYRGAAPGDEIQLHEDATAQVMCVYQAQETPLSFAAKANMLAPYYWPTLRTGYDTAWRTVNHYSAMISQNLQEVFEVCEQSMRAIVGPGVGVFREPTKVNQASLTPEIKQSFNFLYMPLFHCEYGVYNWDRYDYYYRQFTVGKGETSVHCQSKGSLDSTYDSAHVHTGSASRILTVNTFPEKIEGYTFWERDQAYRSPVMCKISYSALERRRQCSSGWTSFKRDSGRVVCHKLYTAKEDFDEASAKCKADGARLSTFTNANEFEVIKKLGGSTMTSRWIGLRKKDGCPVISHGRCEALAIVVFEDDIFADDTEEVRRVFDAHWPRFSDGRYIEPNNIGRDEMCIEVNTTNKLNDLPCDNKIDFVCMKDADVV